MKLLIRGGSIAAGYGVNKGYVDILQNLLRDKGIDVINRSRYRETSFEGIETFQEDIGRFRPDILVVHFGVDDAFEYVYRSEFQENIVQL
ncbi:MAG TPA: SGNH/GDSL hydrolase family protein, partial [Smithella sp.]|nr:SGNH/GDSL hydrolase family protein [Smithella sp.]